MMRRPPRSTRTDSLCPYTNALPICAGEHHLAVDRRDNARRRRFGCEFRIGHRIFEGAEKCPPGEVRAEAFREELELRQDAQRLAIPFETAMIAHSEVQCDFAAVAKGREIGRAHV